MKKFIYPFLFILLLVSCDNGLNKPITEELTIDEIRANMDSEPYFEKFFEDAKDIRSWIMETEIKQAKWGEISYKRIRNYTKSIRDSSLYKEVDRIYKPKHQALYSKYRSKVDSIVSYWTNYLSKNTLEEYVKIEFQDCNCRTLSIGSWEDRQIISVVDMFFKISPLKGPIDKLEFTYSVNLQDSITKIRKDVSLTKASSTFEIHEPISSPMTFSQGGDYPIMDFIDANSEELLKTATIFKYEITSLVKDGIDKAKELKQVPSPIKKFLEINSPDGVDYETVINALVDSSYKSYDLYIKPYYLQAKKDLDLEVYLMLEEYELSKMFKWD